MLHPFNEPIAWYAWFELLRKIARNCTDSQMRLSKRLLKMMTKAMFQYFYVVWLISSLDFIAQCQCSQSANNQQQTSVKRNDTDDVQKQSRRYSDEAEIITSYTNLIGDDEPVEVDDDDSREKDFLYFNDPATISTPKYEPHLPPIPHLSPIDLPNNHKPIHQLERNPAYYPQMDPHLEPIPYDPEESFLDHAPVPPDSIPLHQPIDPTDHYNRPIDPTDHFNGPIDPTDHFNGPPPTDHSISNQLVKVIREPFWAPDFYKLEHRYMDTLRSIKDSFYTFYYKLQDMLYYVVNLFKMPGKFKPLRTSTQLCFFWIILHKNLLQAKKSFTKWITTNALSFHFL